VMASGTRDIVLVTDGKSHALDVGKLARSGVRFTVVLIGEDSLEANVGHLAAVTGGEIFVPDGAMWPLRLAALCAPCVSRQETRVKRTCADPGWSCVRAGNQICPHPRQRHPRATERPPSTRLACYWLHSPRRRLQRCNSCRDGRAGHNRTRLRVAGSVTHRSLVSWASLWRQRATYARYNCANACHLFGIADETRLLQPDTFGYRPLGSCIPRSGLSRSDFVQWHIATVCRYPGGRVRNLGVNRPPSKGFRTLLRRPSLTHFCRCSSAPIAPQQSTERPAQG
jgi:hypothetical protein